MEKRVVTPALRALRLGEHGQELLLVIAAHCPWRWGSAHCSANQAAGVMGDVPSSVDVGEETLQAGPEAICARGLLPFAVRPCVGQGCRKKLGNGLMVQALHPLATWAN